MGKYKIKKFVSKCLIYVLIIHMFYFFSYSKNVFKEKNSLKISMAGDNMTHFAVLNAGAYACASNSVINPKINNYGKRYFTSDVQFDFKNMYKNVKPILDDCDINIINIESLSSGPKYNYNTFPSFNAPYNLIDNVYKSGFNVFLHANNHCLDNGVTGFESALLYEKDHYKDVKIVGGYLTKEDFNKSCIIKKNGIRVSIINYTYGLNGCHLPNDKKYMCSTWMNDEDMEIIKNRVINAKNNSDFVIVCPHWGTEYNHTPTLRQKQQAKLLASWGTDLILGSHPHVIQPDEWIDNTYCIYSVGNLLWTSVTSEKDNRSLAVGLMPVIEISKKKDGKVSIDSININPTIMHEGKKEDVYVTLLKNYDDKESKKNVFMTAYKRYKIDDMWDIVHKCYDFCERKVKTE